MEVAVSGPNEDAITEEVENINTQDCAPRKCVKEGSPDRPADDRDRPSALISRLSSSGRLVRSAGGITGRFRMGHDNHAGP